MKKFRKFLLIATYAAAAVMFIWSRYKIKQIEKDWVKIRKIKTLVNEIHIPPEKANTKNGKR